MPGGRRRLRSTTRIPRTRSGSLGPRAGSAAGTARPRDEDIGLAGQIGPPDSTSEHREAVLLGHVHGPQQLADRGGGSPPAVRTVGSLAMTRHWVRATPTSATDDARRPTGSPVCSPASGRQLEHGRARIDQRLHALAHHHLVAGPMTFDVLRAAPGQHVVVQGTHSSANAAMACALAANSLAGHREPCPDRRRLTASRPTAARASARRRPCLPSLPSPAKSSADVAAAVARRRTSRRPAARRAVAFVARDRAGRRLEQGRALPPTHASSSTSSSTTAVSSRPAAAVVASNRSPVRPCAPGSDGPSTSERRHQIMAAPRHPHLAEGERAAPRHGEVARRDEPEPTGACVPVRPGPVPGPGAPPMVVRISGMRFGAAEPRSDRSAPEQKTPPVR